MEKLLMNREDLLEAFVQADKHNKKWMVGRYFVPYTAVGAEWAEDHREIERLCCVAIAIDFGQLGKTLRGYLMTEFDRPKSRIVFEQMLHCFARNEEGECSKDDISAVLKESGATDTLVAGTLHAFGSYGFAEDTGDGFRMTYPPNRKTAGQIEQMLATDT